MAYALRILQNVGLPCEGITTPGGFGSTGRCRSWREATRQSLRDVFQRRDSALLPAPVQPRARRAWRRACEYAAGLDGADPRCVVTCIGCTGDWTGGWDGTEPGGVDQFITADLQCGPHGRGHRPRRAGAHAGHWTGIYFNGQETGFNDLQEVVRRLHARYDNLLWMKLSEVARYWAAKELTGIERDGARLTFRAPFACPAFTVRVDGVPAGVPRTEVAGETKPLDREVRRPTDLTSATWHRDGDHTTICVDLPKGTSTLLLA